MISNCVVDVLLQVLLAEETIFECRVHDQDVRVFCLDALFMAQLQADIGKNYGAFTNTCRCVGIEMHPRYGVVG